MPYEISGTSPKFTIDTCTRAGWALHICCVNGHGARWNTARLAEDFAPDVTLQAIAERLVCRVCDATEGSLDIFQDVAYTQARDLARFEASGKTPGTGRK